MSAPFDHWHRELQFRNATAVRIFSTAVTIKVSFHRPTAKRTFAISERANANL